MSDEPECTFRVPPPPGGEEARTVAKALLVAATPSDGYVIDHAFAVADLSRLVGTEFGLREGALEALTLGALLHDLGKLGVARSILEKVGPLARWEAESMKVHPDIGARMVEPLWCLRRVAQAIRHHHERYDGGGYPDGLEGEEIPLASRIVAAADAYDVMVRGRPYASARPPSEAVGELLGGVGTQFDARVVAALVRVKAWGHRKDFPERPRPLTRG
jgi:putative nucleotidyltransferase with HDIG domain